jgi:copper oxidase (laccase) domain-containing protein
MTAKSQPSPGVARQIHGRNVVAAMKARNLAYNRADAAMERKVKTSEAELNRALSGAER